MHDCMPLPLPLPQAMDMFDMGDGFKTLEEGVARVTCPVLVLGVTSDVLFPVEQQREMAELLQKKGLSVRVCVCEV